MISTKVAKTVGAGIIDAPTGSSGLQIVFAALLGAIAWNLVTWWFGLPSSSSHALIGGLIGGGIAAAGFSAVQWQGVGGKGPYPGLLSPLLCFVLAFGLVIGGVWVFAPPPAGA